MCVCVDPGVNPSNTGWPSLLNVPEQIAPSQAQFSSDRPVMAAVCVMVWRRWGWEEILSWLECCWRAERTDPSTASRSDPGPVRSASTRLFPPHGPVNTENGTLFKTIIYKKIKQVSITLTDLRRCNRSSAERTATPLRRVCSWNSTDPGTAGPCSPRRAPTVPFVKHNSRD